MRLFILLMALLMVSTVKAQRTYSEQEIKRLADLGRLWGVLHYFHPKMGTGEIVTDSLILSPTASLIADPSAENFERCVNDMLSRLNDPATKLKEKDPIRSVLFTPAPDKPAIHKLPGNVLFVAFPQLATNSIGNVFNAVELSPAKWDSASGVILDLRNANESAPSLLEFNMISQLQSLIMDDGPFPELYERNIYRKGWPLQTAARVTNYSAGWRTSTRGGPNVIKKYKSSKPVVIVFNKNTGERLTHLIMSIKASGRGKIIFEGNSSDYPVGKVIPINLNDGLVANIRVSDFLLGNNQRPPLPDMQVDRITDTSLSGFIIQQCARLLNGNIQTETKPVTLDWEYIPPRLGWYISEQFPTPEKRLFALYNWWNVIQYLYPSKNIIGRDWDGMLGQYIPRMLNAKDSLDYYRALTDMTNEINDQHTGIHNNFRPRLPYTGISSTFPIRLAFVQKKCYVVDIADGKPFGTENIQVWDEITRINGKAVQAIAAEKSALPGAGNDNVFYSRGAPWYVLNFLPDSTVTLEMNRKGKIFTTTIARGTAYRFPGKRIPFLNENPHSNIEILDHNIGYVKIGGVELLQIDSMMKTLENTHAIIFDIRGNPRGPAHEIVPFLTAAEVRAVKQEMPLLTYERLLPGETHRELRSETFYHTIIPNKPGSSYKGKVVVLCNANAESAAEFYIMMFQGVNATTIGSQTAGAAGNVVQVVFPGGYWAAYTSIGIFYPDGRQTQRTGVKIDIEVNPTVAGLKAGRDEVLERAIEFINNGK